MSSPAFAQMSSKGFFFQKTYSGAFAEAPAGIQTTRDGGFILMGQALVSIPDSAPAQNGIRLIRLDEDGSLRWTNCYGGEQDDFGHAVMQTPDGGFLVAGQTMSLEKKRAFGYLLKTDELGRKVWSKAYTALDGAFHSLTYTHDGNYLVLGYSNQQLFAIKVDIRGNHLWTQTYEMDEVMDKPLVKACTADGSDGFVIAGTSAGAFFVLRITTEGKPMWLQTYSNELGMQMECTGVVENRDGGFLVSGTVYRQSGKRNGKICAIRLDDLGNLLWANVYGGSGNDEAFSLSQAGNNGYLIGGTTDSDGGNSQLFALKIADNGRPMEAVLLGGKGTETGGLGLQATQEGGMVMLGRTNGFGLTKPGYYLTKMNPNGYSGGNTRKFRMQVRRFEVQGETYRVRTMPNRYQRNLKFTDCPTQVVSAAVKEQLLCGNAPAVFDPRTVVKAKARSRDSLALVALYNSTNGPQWNESWDLAAPMNAWESIQLDQDGRVMSIILIANELSGTLPPELGNLSKLRYLWLANNHLIGQIPAELGKLKYLEKLVLNNNQLSGPIPEELAKLESLQYLRLDHNQLTGEIPPAFGKLTKLREFRVNDNQLTGDIPPELSNLPMTAQLDLSNNQFSGGIPKAIFELENARMVNNRFAPHAQAKLQGAMGGKYTYNDATGASYVLILNDKTQRFTLMKGSYDDQGGEYLMVRGKFEWNEKGVFLQAELLETGIMSDTPVENAIKTEAYQGHYALEFQEPDPSAPLKVKLRAFDQELQLEKIE